MTRPHLLMLFESDMHAHAVGPGLGSGWGLMRMHKQ
jgi:hypothetical protein